MKLKKMLFTPKQKRELGTKKAQIFFLKFKEPIFLEETKEESLNLLRDLINSNGNKEENKKEFKLFWDIIHKNYLETSKRMKETELKKEWYYNKLKIEAKKNKIKRLKEEIKKEENSIYMNERKTTK